VTFSIWDVLLSSSLGRLINLVTGGTDDGPYIMVVSFFLF